MRIARIELAGVLLLGALVAIGEPAAPAPAQTEFAEIAYPLPAAGFVTLAIDDAQGRRVRNLISGMPRATGPQVEPWDGLDDQGRPVPPGDYRWRGLTRGAITSHFFGAFNSPGSPPWNTLQRPGTWYIRASGDGGWLSDHERPLCMYAAGDRVFVGAAIAEAGHSIVQLDPAGRKQWGTLWLSLSGANAIVADGDILYVAGEKGWLGDSLAVNRLSLKSYNWVGNPPEIQKQRTDACFIKEKSAAFAGIRGMVLTPRFIVLALADRGRLAFFDRERATHVKDMPLPEAGAIVTLADGAVLAISGRTVVRMDLETGARQTVIAAGLVQPSGLGVDSQGRIYVSDIAPAEQCVKRFSPEGKPLGRIGKSGGRREGRFDPMAMGQPVALALDGRDQLWVAEHDFLPKRISVWNTDGKLIRDYIGPPHYGGGGALDPRPLPATGWRAWLGLGGGTRDEASALRGFYKGMEFAVKPWPQASVLQAVLFRPEEHPDLPYPARDDVIPQYPVYRGNKLYLLHDDNYAVPAVFIGEVVKDHLVPRVIFGGLNTLWAAWRDRHPEFLLRYGTLDKPPPAGVFLWQDANGDGRAAPAEVTIQPGWQFGALWAMRSWPTLNLHARDGNQLVVLEPLTKDGGPRYDLASVRRIALPESVRARGICATSPDLEGNVLVNAGGGGNQGDAANVFLSLAPDDQVRWSYPNPYPANWHNSPKPLTGDIQHTLNVEGIVALGGSAGAVFQLNGNKGVRYLFTTDGLFVTALFGDARSVPLQQNLAVASPGLRLDENSLGDECFSGWLGQMADGRVLQIVGKDSSNVTEVRGLETLTRLPGGVLHLTRQAQPRSDVAGPLARGPIRAVQMGGFGYTAGWEKTSQYAFPPAAPVARVAIGYQAHGLRLWLDVEDATPFENRGEDRNTLFHTGDAIDFRLAADPRLPPGRSKPGSGDRRFVIAMFKGKPTVIRYSYVVPDGDGNPVQFASPTGVEQVDQISIIDTAKVEVRREAARYSIAVDLTWADLGLASPPAGAVLGDVGVIFGDPSSQRAVMRSYYFDQGNGVVSDIPSEVRISPARWGRILF